MNDSKSGSFIVECFWPGVRESDLEALDQRLEAVIAALPPEQVIRYLGSILMREDEVVLCQLDGDADAVRRAAVRASVPFERILDADRSPWPRPSGASTP